MTEAHISSSSFSSSLEALHSKLSQCDSKTWHIHQFEADNAASLELYTTQSVSLSSCPLETISADGDDLDMLTDCALIQQDANCITNASPSLDALIEYRIGYSESYEVPLLYLRGHTVSGSSLSLQDMWTVFGTNTGVGSSQILWEALTQVEHPYLHLPYFRIHPCKTGLLMTSVSQKSSCDNYLLLWLSVFGNMVSLDLPVSVAVKST